MNNYYCCLVVYKSNLPAHTSDLAMPSVTPEVSFFYKTVVCISFSSSHAFEVQN